MELDLRYQWIEKIIVSCLNSKRDALLNLVENEDNKLVILEFLNNEDVKNLYIYSKSASNIYASRTCAIESEYEKGIYFLKISNSSKLTSDQMHNQVAYFESSIQIFDHMDLMTREVFMPLLCADINASSTTDQSDKLMDIMHRIISQIAIAQSQVEDSVNLPLPSLSLLATAANNPNRRLTVLHILETTLINWQKQIKNALKQQPEIDNAKANFFTKDEIQLWTSCINKLNNLIVQLDAQHVKDILMNLENNNSSYVQPFNSIKNEIKAAIRSAEINLRYISTLTPWVHKIKTSNLVEEAQYLFTGLFHTLLLIWQHSRYYHLKDRFAHMLLFLSNEIVSMSKQVVGENILQDPLRSYNKLKEALRICAMFRGTYLDFKEKADVMNSKFHKLEKRINFEEKQLWWIQLYSSESSQKADMTDEFEVMRLNSPWPKRNHQCFYYLNVFMERCNDVLELVQTMRHFQILSKTVSIGGSDNQNMDILAQEIHSKYVKAISEFQNNVSDVMSFDSQSKNFETSFFHLRTTIKELERELSHILNLSIKHCTTIGSKLRLLQVFEGVHERDVIQERLNMEYSWLISEILKEFSNVKQLCGQTNNAPAILPSIVTKLFWFYGLEQRIKVPMDKFSYLYPNLLQGDVGYHLRETYKQTLELIEKNKKEAIEHWQSKIGTSLTDKLQQTIFKNMSLEDMLSKRPMLIDVNLDFELEKILKEIRYLRVPPLSLDLTSILKDKFNNINDEKQLILHVTRARLIADKYNLIMKNIQPEEIPLFESKLNKIDSIIELGLNEYTWNSVEIPDFIEKAHSVICTDVYQNLEIIHQNSKEIFSIVNSWCEQESDVFKNRDLAVSKCAKELELTQSDFDESIRKEIVKGGNKIHSLIASNLEAVETSEASPGWQEYINFLNEVIYNGFKISTLQSLRNMFNAMSNENELKNPFVCIDLELVDNKLLFSPPLDENSHLKNLQEILFDFINTFISRGSYMTVLGKNRNNYDQMVARDETTFDLVSKINNSIEKTSNACKKIFDYFNSFSYLWTVDIHITFDEFLKGNSSLSREKHKRPPSKNFMSNRKVAKSIGSLGSVLTPEAITNIERTFLSPYYQAHGKNDHCLTPLLEDFDAEISVYVNTRDKIVALNNSQDVDWIRVNLQPTIDILITLTNKLVWKFTSFLSNQIKSTLNELDQFLKRMEPDIEKITGEERDTETFMKIMRMFNEVSSKQQEMEVKFELMKKTIDLLKKYNRFDVIDLETKFNYTPIRWSNLKSKVTLAKQRLGPTIQEESKLIINDLKQFSIIINELESDIIDSNLFMRNCDADNAFQLLTQFSGRFSSLQNKADDLKQLQELLDSNIVDFDKLTKSRKTLFYLDQIWRAINDIRKKHNEWKAIRWQKVNIKMASEETDKQLDLLHSLPNDIHDWDIYIDIKDEIINIKSCLPIIEEIANPAMRTRHWKNLVRISGSTALVDNEALKMLTFGQLIDLNLHAHVDEVKQIVQKAIKDLSIEQTIKTYEEIWLSKIFQLKKYGINQLEALNKPISNDDDDNASHDRRSSISRIGYIQQSSTTKSTKRLSIGSLPQSLVGLEPIGENEPIYLFEQADELFAELEHHQIVLGELLQNQSAGSFYDEIIRWQSTLQNIEAVLKVWNSVQIKWKNIESAYSLYEIQTILPQDAASFFKTDRDFKILMKATNKNSNILKCCQRKNILSILRHFSQNLDVCYDALLQEMSKKRMKCPRLFLLSDDDLIQVLCSNLDSLGKNISKVFNQIKCLKIEINSANEKVIVGFWDRNKEFVPFKTNLIYKGIIEEFINELEKEISNSLKYLLEQSLNGTFPTYNQAKSNDDVIQANKNLQSIKETEPEEPKTAFSWIFQHVTQIIELSLKILFTKQIESCLSESKSGDLKNLQTKLNAIIEFYSKEMNNYSYEASKPINKKVKDDDNKEAENQQEAITSNPNAGIIMNEQQHDKLELIIKILIYYRSLCHKLLDENVLTIKSPIWLSCLRYYYARENDKEYNVRVKSLEIEVNYGFQYHSKPVDQDCLMVYESSDIKNTICYLISIIQYKSNPLLYGDDTKKVIELLGQALGYEINFHLCSENTSIEVLNNVCKSMVLSGYWTAFLNINNLSSNLMSSFSNILTQLNERKEKILINNDHYALFKKDNYLFAYFATCGGYNADQYMTNSNIDSLKITKIDSYLNAISKDLLEKFQIVKSTKAKKSLFNFFNSNLIVNGFKSNENLSSYLVNLNEIYKLILKVMTKHIQVDFIDASIATCYIREAGNMLFNKRMLNNSLFDNISENNAIMATLSKVILPRLDISSSKMLMNYLKLHCPDLKLPQSNQTLSDNDKLDLPIYFDKETAMQIEDKLCLTEINDAVAVATQKLQLASSISFQTKVVSLIDFIKNHKNILLVGKSGYGKTALIRAAFSSIIELGYSIDKQHIFINSFTNDELFGYDEAIKSSSSRDGLISNTLKNFQKNSNFNIIHFVGESSPKNFFFYESLFNTSENLFLNQNNDKKMNDMEKLRLIWETDDLSNLSPTIITQSNLVYLSSSLTIWEHSIEASFRTSINQTNEIMSLYTKIKNELILKLQLVKNELDSKSPSMYKDVLSVTFESKVKLVLSILRSLMKNNDNWTRQVSIIPLIEYCIASGVSASMTLESKELFNNWIRLSFLSYPSERTIYDYYYDIDSQQFLLWSENIPTFSCPIHQGIPLNIFVHTPSTMFLNSMLDVMMNLDESFLVVGETGCGKTALISDKLKTSCSGDLSELFSITINTNKLTTSNTIYNRLNHHLTWIHGSNYVPKGNKRMYCFIDDIHQAHIDENNRQTAIEFLRQHLDAEEVFDMSTKKWQRVKNLTYIATFNHKVYSPTASSSNKVLKHFHVVSQHFPSNAETHGIFTKLLYRHFIGDIDNESSNSKLNTTVMNRLKSFQTVIKDIIQSSIDLNQKMRSLFLGKSERLHYVFTLRILTSLFRNICLSLTSECTKEQLLLLWHHECDWLYGQRMIDNVDIERYQLAYKTVIKMNFNDLNDLNILNRSVYFSSLKETESGIVVAGFNLSGGNGYLNNQNNGDHNGGNGSNDGNNSNNANSNNTGTSNNKTSSGGGSGGNSGSNVNTTSLTDSYEPTNDLSHIRKLVLTAVNEYNKEQQRIAFPLYESTLNLITRLCHSTQSIGGNCCIVADGGISPFILQLVASLMQYNLIQFKMSQFMYKKELFFQQLKQKLISSYYKAGIRGEKVMICLTEEEMVHKEFLAYITEFLITEEVMHLFTIEEETTILNSIRTQVVQSGYVYTRETAWEFFVKNIRENTRIVIILNESSNKFQTLAVEFASLFNNMELIWIQNWNMKQLVDNALYHFDDIEWLDNSSKENLAHLLATMHSSIRENDLTKSCHLNNLAYTKFVEKFKVFLIKKYKEIEVSHKDTCRLLEHIKREHSIAKKLLIQLQQDTMVLEERIDSTNKMLQQIGQDMTMTEQQLRVHHLQTRKTVQLKRILPEYQSAHERNVYKTVAIVADTKKLIQNINMNSLQELRSIQKPDAKMEDILAAIIMILKSPTADVTWQKGAKRQMANLDRFLEELRGFDEHEITENTIKLLEDFVKKIESYEKPSNPKQILYYDALNTLENWIKGVLRYHTLMIKCVRPLHKKVEEIEREVQEADQKLITLNRKSQALNARLTDLAQNFEEATVDKEEQEEKVIKMKQQLQTASELNSTLSREFDRNMQIYEALQERIFCLPGACALAAGFLVYLGAFEFPFRRAMLTGFWIKCLNDRGLPLVLDSISLIKGRIIKWQMESLSHLLSYANEIIIPGDGWLLNFTSEDRNTEAFIASSIQEKLDNEKTESNNKITIKLSNATPTKQLIKSPTPSNQLPNANNFNEDSIVKMESHAISPISEATSDEIEIVNTSSYRQFIIALVQYIIGEDECLEWMSQDATGLELENGAIIQMSEKYPPLIYDPFASGTNWIMNKITDLLIDLEPRNSEDLLTIERSFQNGTKILYSNSKDIDSILLPLIYYKNSMNYLKNPADDSKLVLYSNRRLFCNPAFQMFFESPLEFNKFTSNILTCTTPISYRPSVENFIDQFQFSLYELMFREEYKKRNLLLSLVKECNEKLLRIDQILKKKWENHGFQESEIFLTKVALQRKYKIGEILDYCHDYLTALDNQMKILTPLAIRASLLMTLSTKMNNISKNYEFSLNLIEFIFISLPSLVKPKQQEFDLKCSLSESNSESNPNDQNSTNDENKSIIEQELPTVPELKDIETDTIGTYEMEDIEVLIKHLTNSFLNSVMTSLLPEHRLYLLTLICFYIKSEQKSNFTDLEMEFLIRGKYHTNLNISLSDFGVPKTIKPPSWIPIDNWNDLLAMSLLQGDLDHFVVAIVSAEQEWKRWYENPFDLEMPKIEMEIEQTKKTELVELNDFRKLILSKVLRPDAYIQHLNEYVTNSLDLKLAEPDWNFVFQNPLYKSVIINMGSQSNISNNSSMSRIHKNLYEIAKNNNQKITGLNCNFLTLTELRVEIKNVQDGFVLLKNAHLASPDVIEFIRSLCDLVNGVSQQSDIKWRLILTKSFDYLLPLSVTSQSLQISFDVIDIIAHNSVQKNRKLTLDTCLIRSETLIFNCVQASLNLSKNDDINELIKNLPQEKQIVAFFIFLVQGLLQSRQNLVCSGLSKWFPWGITCIKQCLIALNLYESSSDLKNLPSFMINNVYNNFLEDELDKDYLLALLTVLINSAKSNEVTINEVKLPLPPSSVPSANYANWLEESISQRKIDAKILQLHPSKIIHYNKIRAEDFIDNLQNLWENASISSLNLTDEIQQDWLYFAMKMCNEKLPKNLPSIPENMIDFNPENAIAFALYKEYNLFNDDMNLVREHLRNLEKYLLLNTQLFPAEWKKIAFTLQSQRVPDEWEHCNCRPSIHTLKSWIQSQTIRYKQLYELYKNKFTNINQIKACVLKQPNSFLASVLLEKCAKNKLNINEAELSFDIKEDDLSEKNGGIILLDLKIINASFDSASKTFKNSEQSINTLPPVVVSVVNSSATKNSPTKIRSYVNQLRQSFVIDMNLNSEINASQLMPYIAFDTGIEELQSSRLHKPIISHLMSIYQLSSNENINANNENNSYSAACITIRQSLSRTNKTLQQIREASASNPSTFIQKETEEIPIEQQHQEKQQQQLTQGPHKTPESQLSYKPLEPSVPALPPNLQTLTRSKPI